ncbi:MAG: type II toxin-antitoxin system Phd/YefM family antitoxin [Prochlorothrix sp.]
MMRTWSVQDAKARFSELLAACIAGQPQIVTKRGRKAAVLVPIEVWQQLQAVAQPSLKQLLLSDMGRTTDLQLPTRGRACRRSIPELE